MIENLLVNLKLIFCQNDQLLSKSFYNILEKLGSSTIMIIYMHTLYK